MSEKEEKIREIPLAEELALWEKEIYGAKKKVEEWSDIISDEYHQRGQDEYDPDKYDLWKVFLEMRKCIKYLGKLEKETDHYIKVEKQRDFVEAIRLNISFWSVAIIEDDYLITDPDVLWVISDQMERCYKISGIEIWKKVLFGEKDE